MKFSAQNSAFSLIELLVVVSLITIMTGTLIPSFTAYLDDQNLKQAQEAVKNDLRSAQNKAMAGSLSDNTVLYWGIRFNSGSGTYTYLTSIDANCNSPDNNYSSEVLPGSIVINGATNCVFFSVANGDRNGSGLVYVYVGKLGASGNNCRSVTIQSNGLIFATQGKVACL